MDLLILALPVEFWPRFKLHIYNMLEKNFSSSSKIGNQGGNRPQGLLTISSHGYLSSNGPIPRFLNKALFQPQRSMVKCGCLFFPEISATMILRSVPIKSVVSRRKGSALISKDNKCNNVWCHWLDKISYSDFQVEGKVIKHFYLLLLCGYSHGISCAR